MKLTSTHYLILLILIVVGGLLAARFYSEAQPSPYDELAQCISDSGALFYGAFWCPHCERQRNMFLSSQEFLPYVECSTPDRENQTQACIDANITSYPTWDMPNGDRVEGVLSFEVLAEATGCTLPAT